MRKLQRFHAQAIALRCVCDISIAHAKDGGDRLHPYEQKARLDTCKKKREIVDNLLVDAYSY